MESRIGAIYGRTSDPKQKSLPSQVAECRELADRLGIRIKYVLTDDGVRSKTLDRPALEALFKHVDDRAIDTVIVWKLDRLVRSLRHLLNVHDWFARQGVDVVSVTEPLDPESSFGRFNMRNICSAAELERDLISERVRLGKARMAKEGRWPLPHGPYGYSVVPGGHLVRNPDEVPVVQKMYRLYVHGVPLTEVSRRLATAGHRGRAGNTIGPQAVGKIIGNPLHVGRLEILGYHHRRPDLRVVTSGTWETALARRGTRCDDGRGAERRRQAIDNVFSDYARHLDDMFGPAASPRLPNKSI